MDKFVTAYMRRISAVLAIAFIVCMATTIAQSQDWNTSKEMLYDIQVRSSPFDPDEANDSRFIVDDGSGLDTDCTFRLGGPLIFYVTITRYVGEVDANGYLTKPYLSTAIDPNALLRMPAYDVDYYADIPPYNPERDEVRINGHFIGYLVGENDTWILNRLKVPIQYLKFPDKDDPDGVENEIRIDIDVANVDIGEEVWCTAIDWAEVTIKAARPVLLVHGFTGEASVWNSVWVPRLNQFGIPNETIQVGKTASMQSNAAMIATRVAEMKDRYGVDKINIVGHSKGGLDSREYIRTHNDVEELVMVGTPNAGSPLADYAKGLISLTGVPGEIVGFFYDPALSQLTTGYMAIYNLFVGENSATSYRAMAGNYDPDILGIDGAIYLWGPDDLVVQVSSVHALSYATNREFITRSPNKEATHTNLPQSGELFNRLIQYLDKTSASSLRPQDTDKGTQVLQVSATGAADVSPTLYRTVSDTGHVAAGETNTHIVPMGSATSAFFQCTWGLGGTELNVTLIDPDGNHIDSASAVTNPLVAFSSEEVFGIMRMEGYAVEYADMSGDWTIEVTGASTKGTDVAYAVSAFIEDPSLTMVASTDVGFYSNGDTVTVTAVIDDGGSPVTDATVFTRFLRPDSIVDTITLYDNATHGDPIASDGQYTGEYAETSLPGYYQAVVTASKVATPSFSREEAVLFSVATTSSAFNGTYGDAGYDGDSDGLYDELRVTVGAEITTAGMYSLSGVLQGPGGTTIAYATTPVNVAAGTHSFVLTFDGELIGTKGIDGPYSLVNLTLVEDNTSGSVIVDHVLNAHTTGPYSASDFQRPEIYFTGASVDTPTDTNSNGLFDLLNVDIGVELQVSDVYQWSARLLDLYGTEIDVASGSDYFTAGSVILPLVFDGEKIGMNGVDGPYTVSDMLIFGSSGPNAVTSDLAETAPYEARAFEGAPPCDCSRLGDLNDDGQLTIVDLILLIDYTFAGGDRPPSDSVCPAVHRGEINCDTFTNLVDVVTFVKILFLNGAFPCDHCAN